MSNPAPALVMSDEQCAVLEVLSKSQTASHCEVQRAQVLLMAARGDETGISGRNPALWVVILTGILTIFLGFVQFVHAMNAVSSAG